MNPGWFDVIVGIGNMAIFGSRRTSAWAVLAAFPILKSATALPMAARTPEGAGGRCLGRTAACAENPPENCQVALARLYNSGR